jgi:hypothetical protein
VNLFIVFRLAKWAAKKDWIEFARVGRAWESLKTRKDIPSKVLQETEILGLIVEIGFLRGRAELRISRRVVVDISHLQLLIAAVGRELGNVVGVEV